ncbi:hypothetical protein HGO97_009830 [Faecalicatena sp. AGMB00832]|uniref:Uncharacterized protein n=2 Tax=Faecalicatena TaxID=2005359 RepID=A0ABS6D3D9_9FIRM|nr:hypothetical protein [Faecalicatena faecalis]MBU3876110.1 hypothetical protein [Faecalicatena faecalis]
MDQKKNWKCKKDQSSSRSWNNRGSALVYVLCVMAVIVVLCLSLLLLSFSMYKSSLGYKNQEQCQLLAVSLSEEIREELENDGNSWYITFDGSMIDKRTPIYSYDSKNKKPGTKQAPELVDFIMRNMWTNGWPYYDEEEEGDRNHSKKAATRELQLDTGAIADESFRKLAGDITVEMYWGSTSEKVTETDSEKKKNGTPLVITVKCKVGKQSSTITRTYELAYSADSKPEDGKEIWGWFMTNPGEERGSLEDEESE